MSNRNKTEPAFCFGSNESRRAHMTAIAHVTDSCYNHKRVLFPQTTLESRTFGEPSSMRPLLAAAKVALRYSITCRTGSNKCSTAQLAPSKNKAQKLARNQKAQLTNRPPRSEELPPLPAHRHTTFWCCSATSLPHKDFAQGMHLQEQGMSGGGSNAGVPDFPRTRCERANG